MRQLDINKNRPRGIKDAFGASPGNSLQYNRTVLENFCSYDLNGASAYLDYGNILNSTLTGVGKIASITKVIKRGPVGTQQTIFAKWDGGTNNRAIFVRFTAANRIQVAFSNNGTGATAVNSTVATFTNVTDFYMITFKFDMSAANWSGVKLNVNGLDCPFQVPAGAISSTIFASNAPVRLSTLTSGGGAIIEYFEGLYNDIAVYNKFISDGELLTRNNGGDILKSDTISNRVWGSDFVEDVWNGSEFDVIDNQGSDDGITVNVLESEKLCIELEV